MYLLAEYCGHNLFTGWHLYLRDNKNRQQRNADGDWGWVRWSEWREGRRGVEHPAQAVFDELGIKLKGDGTCDDHGYAELAKRFPIPRQRIWRRPRGCVEVVVDEWRRITLAPEQRARLRKMRESEVGE